MVERKSYRSAPKEEEQEEKYEGEQGYPEDEGPTPRRPVATRGANPAPRATSRPVGRPASGGGRSSGEGTFITITGFFPSKSGKADTVFVKDDIFEQLQAIQPGDTLGVSMNKKTNRLQLWYIQKG